MALLEIYDNTTTDETFLNFLASIKKNVETYSQAKSTAQRERMIIIGKISDYQRSFPQRSNEHRALAKAMESEGWSRDCIDNNKAAFRWYSRTVNSEYTDKFQLEMAETASVTHMAILERAQSGALEEAVYKYYKRNKKMPAVSSLRGWLGGFFTDKFESLSARRHQTCQRYDSFTPALNKEKGKQEIDEGGIEAAITHTQSTRVTEGHTHNQATGGNGGLPRSLSQYSEEQKVMMWIRLLGSIDWDEAKTKENLHLFLCGYRRILSNISDWIRE
ncbi:hypothetical protein EVJ50_01895 [Synechococcus sp. RSCCF101]|nr:hypothetical protein EVJ50_01895 [Synechococcus sp. RSCCF101]